MTDRIPIKLVLMGDFHVDYDYVPGMASKCDRVICCRSDSGYSQLPENTAGKWGDYDCDLPPDTLDSML